MKRYAAFLRGVTPMNAKMPELKKAFEGAGFEDVKTILSSGNVVFGAASSSTSALEREVEGAVAKHLGVSFPAFIRSIETLRGLISSRPYDAFRVPPAAKRVVTFLRRKPKTKLEVPIEVDGATILLVKGTEVFTAYVRSPRGPVFMTLIEKSLGKDVTTRTWDTVARVAR
jgi:uncharacterized protein (DUF1697 family)